MSTALEHGQHQAIGRRYPLCLLAHDIEDALNVGSLFRLVDALGLEHLYLSGTSAVPPNRKLRRTSRATEQYVAYTYSAEPYSLIERLKQDGYTVIALEITDDSIALDQLPLSAQQKLCLIVGAENTGVEQGLLDSADVCTHIVMHGNNSSMNLAMACSIAAYDIIRRMA